MNRQLDQLAAIEGLTFSDCVPSDGTGHKDGPPDWWCNVRDGSELGHYVTAPVLYATRGRRSRAAAAWALWRWFQQRRPWRPDGYYVRLHYAGNTIQGVYIGHPELLRGCLGVLGALPPAAFLARTFELALATARLLPEVHDGR